METMFMQNFGGKTKSIVVFLKLAYTTAHPWALEGAVDRNGDSFLGIYPTTVTNENGQEEREASGKSGPTLFIRKQVYLFL